MTYPLYLFKKVWKRKSNFILLILIGLLMGGLAWNSRQLANKTDLENLEDTFKSHTFYANMAIKNMDESKERDKKDITNLNLQSTYLEKMIEGLKKNDLELYLKNNIALLKLQKEIFPVRQGIPGLIDTPEKNLLIKEALYTQHIAPEGSRAYQGITFIFETFNIYGPIIFTSLILLICSPIATSFYRKKINIEKGLPLFPFVKILFRTAVLWGVGMSVFLSLLFLGYLFSGLVNGFGSFSYPLLTYSGMQYSVTPLWQVLIKIFLLYSFVVLFLSSVIQILAQLTKNYLATLFLAMLTLVGTFNLTFSSPDFSKILPYLPTTYLKTVNIVNGVFSSLQNNPLLSMKTGILVTLSCSLFFILMSWLLERGRFRDELL